VSQIPVFRNPDDVYRWLCDERWKHRRDPKSVTVPPEFVAAYPECRNTVWGLKVVVKPLGGGV
jgi:hypothetical protein